MRDLYLTALKIRQHQDELTKLSNEELIYTTILLNDSKNKGLKKQVKLEQLVKKTIEKGLKLRTKMVSVLDESIKNYENEQTFMQIINFYKFSFIHERILRTERRGKRLTNKLYSLIKKELV